MKLITLFALTVVANFSDGQILFNKTYNKTSFEFADAVIERKDRKYLIAGSSFSQFETDYDVNILLIDSVGNLIWDKFIGQSPRSEYGFSLIETNDSNYAVLGISGFGMSYLAKFDSSGIMLWDKEYLQVIGSYVLSLGQNYLNNYFFLRGDNTLTTLFLTTSGGDSLWAKQFSFASCKSVKQTSDSGFVLTGNMNSIANVSDDIVLIKTNSVGDTIWTKTFGGAGKDDAASVLQLADDGYLIAGNFDTQIVDDNWETFIIRTNSAGDTLWTQKYYLGDAHYIAECKNNNGYILSTKDIIGHFPFDKHYLVITKLDTLGNIEWSNRFNLYNFNLGNNISQTSDGGYILTGTVDAEMTDVSLIKIDSLGNFVTMVQTNSNSLKVFAFPNPTTNEISFSLSSARGRKIKQVQIFNPLGRELQNLNYVNELQIKIDVKYFAKGLYFYKVITMDNEIVSGKFIVKE